MLFGFGVFWCCVLLVAGERPPYADYIDELIKKDIFAGRISNNVTEDANLDLASLVRKYNYPFEEHFVTTPDGYILGMHRIPHGRDANTTTTRTGNKTVVFLMHGLFCSSADFIVMGPGTALAYMLADRGFDVWLGNARGNYFSRRNIRLNPDALIGNAFWQFSWDEIGHTDLPAMIDYVLEYTGKSALHYIGHSQGTTSFYVMGSLRPAYNKKIISMHSMAPIAYMAHVRNLALRAISPFEKAIMTWANLKGLGEVLPRSKLITLIGEILCPDGALTQPICVGVLFFVGGISTTQLNTTMLPAILGHNPAGSSLRQVGHYCQCVTSREFRRYDFGLLRNLREYGQVIPPRYNLSQISAPVFLHYSETDPLAAVKDVDRLFSELGNPAGKLKVQTIPFSHTDYIWGNNAKGLVYERIVNIMRTFDSD